jgi:octaprenyl-diphosphate synthase
MQLDAIKLLINDSLVEVERLLDQQLDSKVALIKEIGAHLIKSGGKRIRPTLVILVAHAYPTALASGVKKASDVLLGTAIELIHAATLLHDDVVDNSQLRRSEETANAIWDNAASVLVGDFLYSRAFQLIVSVEEVAVLKMLAEATNIIATGEMLQLQNRHNLAITEENYLDVLRYKTGALFAAATQAGAISANRSAAEIQQMANFGEYLGIAFQLTDDLLDYVADEKALGKQLGDDLAEGKITLPLLHALKHADEKECEFIKQAILSNCRTLLPELQKIVKNTKSLDYTFERAQHYAQQARNCLDILQQSPYKDALIALTHLVVQREY